MRLTVSMLLLFACRALAQNHNFTVIENWKSNVWPYERCGSPGMVACIGGCADVPHLAVRSGVCNMPAPACTPLVGLFPPNPHDFTFLVMSDLHLKNGWHITDPQHVRHVEIMNRTGKNGWTWDRSNAGFPKDPVSVPLAVVSTGDETDDGTKVSLGAFRLLYEPGYITDSLTMPLFPGLGNHDLSTCDNGGCRDRMLDHTSDASTCSGVTYVDPVSRNYSWDWGKYHMVQLNTWAGDTVNGNHNSGLPWLLGDLLLHVGISGRPVIIFQHYGWDPLSTETTDTIWWNDADRASFLSVIQNYNVQVIFTGHDHNLAAYSVKVTDSGGRQKVIDDIAGGTGGQGAHGEFFVVRLTDQSIDVMPVQWLDPAVFPNSPDPYPTGVGAGVGRPAFFNAVEGCRKWVGPPLLNIPLTTAPANSRAFTITNNTPGTLQGPFALQFNSLTYSYPALPGQILFTGSCTAGPLYVQGQKTSLVPGESETITLSYTAPTLSGVVTMSGSDFLVATPNSVTVPYPYTDTQYLNLTSAVGSHVPVTASVDQPWVNVGVDNSSTPARLKFSITLAQLNSARTASITVKSSNAAYPSIQIGVSLGAIPVTFTTTGKGTVTVDGNNYSLPITLNLPYNTPHKATAADGPVFGGVQYRFMGWPGGVSAFLFTTSAPVTYTVNFQRFVQVTSHVFPSGSGTVVVTPSSPDAFYATGTALQFTATANPGYVFSRFHNQPLGQNPIAITAPDTVVGVTAEFNQAATYSVSTSLGAAGSETIDGATTQGPATVQWALGTQHTVSVRALISPAAGTRYLFTQWSDGVTTNSRSITAGAVTTFVAQYRQQFQVTLAASPVGGGVVAGAGWYGAGKSATLSATPANGFTFSAFSGTLAGTQNPMILAVTQPLNLVANFAPGTPAITVSAGAHNNIDATSTVLTLVFTNTGAGAAWPTSIRSIVPAVQTGSGTVVVPATLPSPGMLLPGQSVSLDVPLAWPSTAAKVGFTVTVAANGGTYASRANFSVVR